MEERDYYYCTKQIRFSKKAIIKYIFDLFEERKVEAIPFEDLYAYLQEKLQVTSVNRKNLRDFLDVQATTVSVTKIGELFDQYLKEDNVTDCNTISLSFADKLSRAIDILGWEFIYNYLSSDGHAIRNFLYAINSLNPNNGFFASPIAKIDENLRDYICSFSEKDIIELLHNDPELFCSQYTVFIENVKEAKKVKQFTSELKQQIEKISPDNHPLCLSYLLKSSVATALNEKGVIRVEDFCKISDKELESFYGENQDIYLALVTTLQNSLIAELQKDFLTVVQLLKFNNKPNKEWKRYVSMMYARLHGETLASIGEQYNVTRERIRQVEAKYIRYFKAFFYKSNGERINVLRAFAAHKCFMSREEIMLLVGEYYELFIFLLDEVEGEEILFANELNVILFEEGIERYEAIQNDVANLPDSFSETDLDKFTDNILKENESLGIDFSIDIVKSIIIQDYKLLGTIYSRASMPLSQRYDMVLRKYFPKGIYIYDSAEIQKFRAGYIDMFGEEKLSDGNRALIGRVSAISILCDRGKYIAKTLPLISKELLTDICTYIEESEKEIFLTNTLFYIFEDRLVAEGITNKYYLQGILHELVGHTYYFKRDYVCKSKETTSFYSLVVSFIRDAGKVVSKDDIYREFPAIPGIVLAIACQDRDIINCFGKYLHRNILAKNEGQVEKLKQILDTTVNDGLIHSCDDIMDALKFMHPDILDSLKIDSKYTLFSIINAAFEHDFSFSRPYIAKKGIEIGNQTERLKAFLAEQDETDIADFMEFAHNNSLRIWSILKQINDLNDEFFLKDKFTIIKIEATGLTKYNLSYVDDFIEDVLDGEELIVGGQIHSFKLLPKCNVKWNDWLLYSYINKWSSRYKVITTDNQLRFSEPVFLKKETPADTMAELLQYIKKIHNFDEASLMLYMKNKGLII